MKYFESHSDNRIIAYDTNKQFIDASSEDLFGDFEDHNDGLESTTKGKEKYIESHPSNSHNHLIISDDIDEKIGDSPLKFFLDGSRHVYRTNDLIIAGNVFPVVTGQIVVGCCKREGREVVKHDFKRKIILAVPRQFDYDNQGENFLRKKCEEINAALREKDKENAIEFNSIVCYKTDGDLDSGKNKYLHQAITVVQNEMMDQERIMVEELCTANFLNSDAWLVKDGTLEYKKEFTNRPDQSLDIARFTHKLKYVIGVSKMFNPELLSAVEKEIGRYIADLEPHCRTNAYRYKHQGKTYCVWYLRLRNTTNRATRYSDIVKVEFIVPNDKPVDSSLIDNISAHLINEAYPVCFGKDARWANHLYPIYLTESFCKAKYMNEDKIIKLV